MFTKKSSRHNRRAVIVPEDVSATVPGWRLVCAIPNACKSGKSDGQLSEQAWYAPPLTLKRALNLYAYFSQVPLRQWMEILHIQRISQSERSGVRHDEPRSTVIASFQYGVEQPACCKTNVEYVVRRWDRTSTTDRD